MAEVLTRSEAEDIVDSILKEQSTSVQKIYDQLSQADNLGFLLGNDPHIKALKDAAAHNSLDTSKKHRDQAEEQFNTLINGIVNAVNVAYASDANSTEELTRHIHKTLTSDSNIYNAIGYMNDLRAVQDQSVETTYNSQRGRDAVINEQLNMMLGSEPVQLYLKAKLTERTQMASLSTAPVETPQTEVNEGANVEPNTAPSISSDSNRELASSTKPQSSPPPVLTTSTQATTPSSPNNTTNNSSGGGSKENTQQPQKKKKQGTSNYSTEDAVAIVNMLDNPPPALKEAITDGIVFAQRGSDGHQERNATGINGFFMQIWNFLSPIFNWLGDMGVGVFAALTQLFSSGEGEKPGFFSTIQETRALHSTNRQMKMALDNVSTLTAEELEYTGPPEQFEEYKLSVMYATAEALGEQARRNGHVDTPNAYALMAGYLRNSPVALTEITGGPSPDRGLYSPDDYINISDGRTTWVSYGNNTTSINSNDYNLGYGGYNVPPPPSGGLTPNADLPQSREQSTILRM